MTLYILRTAIITIGVLLCIYFLAWGMTNLEAKENDEDTRPVAREQKP